MSQYSHENICARAIFSEIALQHLQRRLFLPRPANLWKKDTMVGVLQENLWKKDTMVGVLQENLVFLPNSSEWILLYRSIQKQPGFFWEN